MECVRSDWEVRGAPKGLGLTQLVLAGPEPEGRAQLKQPMVEVQRGGSEGWEPEWEEGPNEEKKKGASDSPGGCQCRACVCLTVPASEELDLDIGVPCRGSRSGGVTAEAMT